MNSIHSNFSTSFFRQFDFASALSAPSKKTAAGNEGRGEGPVVGIVRDKLTLSHEGQLAYAKHISKLDKAQSVPAAQTQATEVVDSTSTDVDTVDKTEQNTQTTQTQAAESVDSNGESSSVPVLDKEKPVSDLEEPHHTPAGAQDERLSAANTSANSKIKEMWTLDENGNKLDKIDVSAVNLLTMDYESASPEQRNLIDWAKRVSAIHQWERDNDFSFSRTEGSNPLTPEEKKEIQ